MNQQEIKNCPFCNRPSHIIFNDLGNSEYIARCSAALSCGARGGAFHTQEEAAEKWNTRAPTKNWRNNSEHKAAAKTQ